MADRQSHRPTHEACSMASVAVRLTPHAQRPSTPYASPKRVMQDLAGNSRRHCRAPPASSRRAAAAGAELKRWQLWAPRRELPGGWSGARCGLRLRDAAGPERGDRCVGAGRVRGFARVRGGPPGSPLEWAGLREGWAQYCSRDPLQWLHPQGCHLPVSSLPGGGKPRQQRAPRAAGSWDRPLTAAMRGVAELRAPPQCPGAC